MAKSKADELRVRAMLAMGSQRAIMRMGRQALPQSIDDAERDFGPNIYDRMANDAAIDGAIDQIRLAVLADGWRVVPTRQQPSTYSQLNEGTTEAEFERAKEMAEFCTRQLEQCTPSFSNVLENFLDAVLYGHKLIEIVLEPREGRLELAMLMPRPKQMYAFVADEHMRIYGVYPCDGASTPALIDMAQVLPMEKFLVWTMGGRDGDPRGRSQLRQAYTAWAFKQGMWPGWDRFMEKFATPSVVGKLGPDAQQPDGSAPDSADDADVYDSTPEEYMLAKLIEWANATAVVVENGAEVDVVESKSNGEAYASAMDICDRQMQLAILNTTRASLEAKHGSRADSDSAQDVVMRIARFIRRELEELIGTLFRRLIAINFGEDMAESFTPALALASQPDPADNVDLMGAINEGYRSGFIHDSQLEELDARLGLPKRDMASMLKEKAEQREQQQRSQRLIDSLSNPEEA